MSPTTLRALMKNIASVEDTLKLRKTKLSTLTSVVVLTIFIVGYTVYGLKYPIGTLSRPGSGVVPRAIALVMLVGLALWLISTVRGRSSSHTLSVFQAESIPLTPEPNSKTTADKDLPSSTEKAHEDVPIRFLRAASIPLSVIAFVVSVHWIGFLLAGSAISFLVMTVTGGRQWWIMGIGSAILAVAIAILIGGQLKVPLPGNFG